MQKYFKMNIKTLENYAKKFNNGEKFYILQHKKHNRYIYFKNNSKAINFIKRKLQSSLLKRSLYKLISFNIIQPILPSIILPKTLGDVVLVANRLKCIDLHNKVVHNFPLNRNIDNFIKTLNFRTFLGEEYCPKLLNVDRDAPFFTEEFLEEYDGDIDTIITKLKKLNSLTGLIHGDLVKEHILKRGETCVFIDWQEVKHDKVNKDIKTLKEIW